MFEKLNVELSPSALTAAPGDTFALALNLADVEGLIALDALMRYDPDILTVSRVDIGELGRTGGLIVESNIQASRGLVKIVAFRAAPVPLTVGGEVAVIQFEVLAGVPAGTTMLDLAEQLSIAGQTSEGESRAQQNAGRITIAP